MFNVFILLARGGPSLPALLPLQHSRPGDRVLQPNARGILILLGLASALLALFDYDEHVGDAAKANSFSHALHHLLRHYGMSDHKVGVFSLIAFGFVDYQCQTGDRNRLAGSSVAANLVISALCVLGLVADHFREAGMPLGLAQSGYLVLAGCVSSMFLFPSSLDFKVSRSPHQMAFPSVRFLCGLGAIAFWQIRFLTRTGPHPITPVAVTAFALLTLAVHHTARANSRSTEILEKYQSMYCPDGLPGRSEPGVTATHAVWQAVKTGFGTVTQHTDSRQIFYFLCLNLSFMVVEMLYGMWTNSLGLISDGFHMLFDCTALILGLCASIVSRRPPNKTYTYGYGRVDLLSAYINGLFLFIVGFFVLIEALSRLFNPPDIISDKLLTVSIAGLLVNLVGVFLFGHLHHGCGGCSHSNHPQHHHEASCHHSCSTSFGHDRDLCIGVDQLHNRNEHSYQHHHHHGEGRKTHHTSAGSANMRGVFLHVLADTFGSVGVIISSLLIRLYKWNIADPICSLFIAIMILVSVTPMILDAAENLCLRIPRSQEMSFYTLVDRISRLPSVVGIQHAYLWMVAPGRFVGAISIVRSSGGSNDRFEDAGLSNDRLACDHLISTLMPECNEMYVQVINDGALHGKKDSMLSQRVTIF